MTYNRAECKENRLIIYVVHFYISYSTGLTLFYRSCLTQHDRFINESEHGIINRL
jgi:hypothetical protein